MTRRDDIDDDPMKLAHDALDRMRRAHERGTGCHLTADMVFGLSVTFLGETWAGDRPDDNGGRP
jgi:hypothetical protein